MKIFAGSSNLSLAKLTARETNLDLGQMTLARFTNDEARVYIKDQDFNDPIILQSLSNPVDHHIIEFCLIADALKRLGSTSMTAVIPYLGYSKQDKVFRPGEPLSVKVIANILQTAPIKKIITFDLHNPAIMGFFDIPLINLKALPLFVNYFSPKLKDGNYLVVSPDAGAVKASTEFANALGLPIAYINKKRDLQTGQVSIVAIDREISESHILILDDMIATGGTMLAIADFLKSHGALSITIAATHHLYLPGVQAKFDASPIDHLVVTNSIQKPTDLISSKLSFIHLENLLASQLA